MSDPVSTLAKVRGLWEVIRGAQTDMLNGRPDMDALEEIALASAAIDELLAVEVSRSGTDDGDRSPREGLIQ